MADQPDHMRPRQAAARLGDSKVAINGVSAQTIRLEVLVTVMADGDALFRPRPFGRSDTGRLGLTMFGTHWFSRAGCANDFSAGDFAGGFFLRGGAGRGSRFRLLLGHPMPPHSRRTRFLQGAVRSTLVPHQRRGNELCRMRSLASSLLF
jgi:hypothetical protein